MALVKSIIFTVVIVALLLESSRVNGRVITSQVHNKPHVKTIKTEDGDIYDCVDFYEQPGFKHRLLINHTLHPEIKPSNTPKRMDGKGKTEASLLGFKDGGCPFGTVPIRRVANKQRDRPTMLNINNAPGFSPGHQFAILQPRNEPGIQNYYGVGARFGVFNPAVNENFGQYSSAQCMIQNGPDSIRFGWTVDPQTYPDKSTRMFIRTEAGTTHCYNTECSGFIIVQQDMKLDSVLPTYSNTSTLVTISLLVFRDNFSGQWWLTLGEDGSENTKIGFWPGDILGSLSNYGTYIECGGAAYSNPNSSDDLPNIGNGKFPIGSFYYDAFVQEFVTVNDKFQIQDVQNSEIFVSNDKYGVHDFGIDKDVGHSFIFGGPNDPSTNNN